MAKIEYIEGQLESPVATLGHVKSTAFDSRVYYKPSINRLVVRTKGVLRKSKAVSNINDIIAKEKPAKKCKGLSMTDFRKCLREKTKSALHAAGYPKKPK